MKQFTPFFVLGLFLSFFNSTNSQLNDSVVSNPEIVSMPVFDGTFREFPGNRKSPYWILHEYQEINWSIAPGTTYDLLDKVVLSGTNLPAGGLKRASMCVS